MCTESVNHSFLLGYCSLRLPPCRDQLWRFTGPDPCSVQLYTISLPWASLLLCSQSTWPTQPHIFCTHIYSFFIPHHLSQVNPKAVQVMQSLQCHFANTLVSNKTTLLPLIIFYISLSFLPPIHPRISPTTNSTKNGYNKNNQWLLFIQY